MKAALTYARTTLGFLAGALALASVFVLVTTAAVLHSHVSHGSPTENDYWFAVAALAALTLGFASGAAVFGRSTLPLLPTRIPSIAGAGAVALLLVTMMLLGKSLGMSGSISVGFIAGGLAAGVSIGLWRVSSTRSMAAAPRRA